MSAPTVADLGERALIERLRARISMPAWVVVGPGDDAAVVTPPRGGLDVLTVDAQVDGVHFDRRFVPAHAIGHRALAVNLSDLAAMGAEPRGALLSLVLPSSFTVGEFDALLDGFLALADRHRTTLLGGNITRTDGPLVVDVTALGSVRPRRILSRQGARPGDGIYVTGSLGAAAIGLRLLRMDAGNAPGPIDATVWTSAPERYLQPEPRVRAGQLLGRNRVASSCIDLSDGLADGVHQIARASGVGVSIDGSIIPRDADVTQWHEKHGGDPVETLFAGGDDYELLFTVRPAHRGRLRLVSRQLGALTVTRIGVVTKDPAVVVTTSDGTRPLPQGYEHYR